MSSHYKSIRNGKGTKVWIVKGKYISIGKNGTDITIRGNRMVLAFDDWDSLLSAIDYKKAAYYHQDDVQEVSTDIRMLRERGYYHGENLLSN